MQTALDDSAPIGATELSRLRWRCRRGLLENDLFIARFFQRHEVSVPTPFPTYIVRARSIDLIFPMASVGLRPLGQTSTQFMMVWQRNRR